MNNRELANTSEVNLSFSEVEKANNLIEGLCGKESTELRRQTGGVLEGSYRNRNLKRSFYHGTQFVDCDFTSASATGVIWKNGHFLGGTFDYADFEYADLSGSKWECLEESNRRPRIHGAGFNGVNLRNCKWTGVDVQGSSFAHADLSEAILANSDMHGTFEGCLFNRAQLNNISFVDSNVDYADFTEAECTNVDFSLLAFPYLFGVHSDGLKNENGITLKASSQGSRNTIRFKELRSMEKELVNYYVSRGEFFPAANLSLFFGAFDRFLPFFISGARRALETEDYRSLKFLSKLIRQAEEETGEIGKEKLRQMYDMITARVGASDSPAALNQYELHDGQIRRYLLGKPEGTISLCYTAKTCDGQKAQRILVDVSKRVVEVCALSGIEVEVVSSHVALHSPARTQIEIRIVEIRQDATSVVQQPSSVWNAPTILALLLSAASLFLDAQSAVSKWVKTEELSLPPKAYEYAEKHRPEIQHAVLRESFEMKDGLRTLMRTDGDTVILSLDSLQDRNALNSL